MVEQKSRKIIVSIRISVVTDNFVCALHEQFDCCEALDLDQLVGGGVHLGNDNALEVFVFFSQFVPDGDELLAVSAGTMEHRIQLNKI